MVAFLVLGISNLAWMVIVSARGKRRRLSMSISTVVSAKPTDVV
jgi:hypothetical protein